MTAVVVLRPLRLGVAALVFMLGWFVAATFVLLEVARPGQVGDRSVMVRSLCQGAISLVTFDGRDRHRQTITLRGPGLYQIATSATVGELGVASGDRRTVSELALGTGREHLLPAAWCAPTAPGHEGVLGLAEP